MPEKNKNIRKAFTLVELLVAVGLMAAVMAGSGVIFNMAIKAQRYAGATAEIMRNLRAITDQLNTDFRGLRKDGFLLMSSQSINVSPVINVPPIAVNCDNILYFATGDFDSLINPARQSNIAKIYVGHYDQTFSGAQPYCSNWIFLRRAMLLLPAETDPNEDDYLIKSFAAIKADYQAGPAAFINNYFNNDLFPGYPINVNDPMQNWQYFCGGVGNIKIEWTDGTTIANQLEWFGLTNNIGAIDALYGTAINENTTPGGVYTAEWTPDTQAKYWPKALKFTFTLYDFKSVFKEPKTFTHIVYIGD